MRTANPFVAITPYGIEGASARVRVLDWIARVAPEVPVYTYAGTRNNSPYSLLSHPAAVVRAEIELRQLAKARNEGLLLHRAASPFSRGGLEAQILRSAEWTVYDFDDALQWESGGRPLTRALSSNVDRCIRCVGMVDRVVAGNEVLAEWAGQYARDVVVIPSCVDPTRYVPKEDFELSDPPRLVWIGTVSTEKFLRRIESALLEIHRRLGVRLVILGENRGSSLGQLEVMTDRIAWTAIGPEHRLHEFDLGIGPLDDDVFARGKCAYKLLQYGAAGLPFVASPVGANLDVARSLGGSLARNCDEWIDQLEVALTIPAADRRKRGEQARQGVQNRYTFEVWAETWKSAVGLATSSQLLLV